LLVHIGDPSSNQATTLESQMIHMIQELFGQTLRERDHVVNARPTGSVVVAALLWQLGRECRKRRSNDE
jgi:hypothetical protein